MSNEKTKNRLVAPLVTALLMTSALGIDDANAQRRRGDGDGNRDGRRGDRNGDRNSDRNGDNTGGTVSTPDRKPVQILPDTWQQHYIGTPDRNLRLTNNPRMAKLVDNVNNFQRQHTQAAKLLKEKKEQIIKLVEEQGKIEAAIAKLEKETVDAVAKKAELQKQIRQIKKTLRGLKTAVTLAQTAFDATAAASAEAEAKLETAKQKLGQLETQCSAAPTPECQALVDKQKQVVTRLERAAAEKKRLAEAALKDLKSKKDALATAENNIKTKEGQIAKIDQENTARAQKIAAEKQKLAAQAAKIAKAGEEMKPLAQNEERLYNNLVGAAKAHNAYKKELQGRLLSANTHGADMGRDDGRTDGLALARRIGNDAGLTDGDVDGRRDGERVGYSDGHRDGYQDGVRIGRDRANTDGERVGTAEGIRAGNTDAGQREGRDAGEARAQNSDAAAVGTAQGNSAGMDRAVSTGKLEGTRIGEDQAVAKYENVNLPGKVVSGAFDGTFDRVIPRMPHGHRGPNFQPGRNDYRRIMRLAYADGYTETYRQRQRDAYQRNIEAIYNNAYDRSYGTSYQASYDRSFSNGFGQGQSEGDRDEYNRVFPGVRESFFRQARSQFSNNPNRSSEEYRVTFDRVERDTYKQEYENIRSANYQRAERDTFEANIAEQTEIYRAKRFASVKNVYENNAVLSFVGSKIKDAGINGVAANDGIFQPGETTLHDVIIKNFGKKAASNATVTLADGSKAKLPTIPAGAVVTVKNALKGKIQASRPGQSERKTLRVYSPLTAEAKVQGRHYANASQGLVNSGDQKNLGIQFPLQLSRLTTNGTPVINEAIQLLVDLKNKSNRKYTGALKIEVSVNSKSNIISKTFGDVQSLDSTLRLKDAQVKVTDESDVYTPLRFTARVSKNGVLLGTLDQSFNTMVKAPYSEKAGKPVIVVNSDQTRVDLLDVVSELGGINNAAVLDLSLAGRNGQIMKTGLKNKTALVIDRGNGSVINNFDHVLAKSENTVFIYVDDNAQGLKLAEKTKSFKDAGKFAPSISGIGKIRLVFTNPEMKDNKNLKGSQVAMQSSRNGFKKLLPIAELFKSGKDQMIASIKSQINRGTYFNPSKTQSQLVEVMNIRGLAEFLNINSAYKASGGIFGRSSKIAKRMYKDGSLMYNKLRETLKKTRLDNNSVGLHLVGVNAHYTISKAISGFKDISNEMSAIRGKNAANESGDLIEEQVKKPLKSFDRGLYKKVYKNENIFTPFEVSDDDGVDRFARFGGDR